MKKLLKDAGAIIGYILGLVGAIVTICLIPGNIVVDMRWVVILGILIISLIVIAVMSVIRFNNIAKSGTRYMIVAYDGSNNKDSYYTEYTDNLRVDTLVCIYYAKPMSRIVCQGIVKNSSIDEYVEIEVLHVEDSMRSIFEKSKSNNQKVLNDMYLLPNVYYKEFAEIKRKIEGEEINAQG